MSSALPAAAGRGAGNSALVSPLAQRVLAALRKLERVRQPHHCGGFTADDMRWQMGAPFMPKELLWEAVDELTNARLIRATGHDFGADEGTCYGLCQPTDSARNPFF